MALFFFYIMDVFCFPSFLYYCYFLLVLGCFEDRVTWLDHYLSEGYCWTWTPVDRSAGSTAICSRSTPFFWFILSFFKECQVLRFKQIKIKIVFSYEMFIISGSLFLLAQRKKIGFTAKGREERSQWRQNLKLQEAFDFLVHSTASLLHLSACTPTPQHLL